MKNVAKLTHSQPNVDVSGELIQQVSELAHAHNAINLLLGYVLTRAVSYF